MHDHASLFPHPFHLSLVLAIVLRNIAMLPAASITPRLMKVAGCVSVLVWLLLWWCWDKGRALIAVRADCFAGFVGNVGETAVLHSLSEKRHDVVDIVVERIGKTIVDLWYGDDDDDFVACGAGVEADEDERYCWQ